MLKMIFQSEFPRTSYIIRFLITTTMSNKSLKFLIWSGNDLIIWSYRNTCFSVIIYSYFNRTITILNLWGLSMINFFCSDSLCLHYHGLKRRQTYSKMLKFCFTGSKVCLFFFFYSRKIVLVNFNIHAHQNADLKTTNIY